MKAWKLQECVAHSPGAVTCVCLGRKSGRVMATGGEDRRVKLWAVGKPTCILSLTGHTSSVEATEFSQEEDRVAAGSLSGSIRIWDLEEVKIVRTLSGHTSGISSLDFHPFGNFIASGSIDTVVKLWDVSRKGCINSYRGHTGSVNMVRFSPDGKWVVSGGEDGVVKLWDLSAGRQLAELTGHAGPVTAVAFHPTVLLLATASSDHTVRLFDLENFSQVAVSGIELAAATIRRIAFHTSGVCLYVATADCLKIYDHEPMTCIESVHVGWRAGGGLDDMAIAPSFNQLVGASITNSMLSTYVVDIKSCLPFVEDPQAECTSSVSASDLRVNSNPPDSVSPTISTANVTEVFHSTTERPYTRCGPSNGNLLARHRKGFCLDAEENAHNTLREDCTNSEYQVSFAEESGEPADINDPEEYDRIFKPRRAVPRSPTHSVVKDTSRLVLNCSPFTAPQESSGNTIQSKVELVSNSNRLPSADGTAHASSPNCSKFKSRQSDEQFVPPAFPYDVNSTASRLTQANRSPPVSTDDSPTADELEDVMSTFAKHTVESRLVSAIQDARSMSEANLSDSELLSSIRKPHNSFMSVMLFRAKNLSTVRMLWTRNNIRTAVETTLSFNEPAILVDVLNVLVQNSKLWSLDLANLLLPHLALLIGSKYSTHVETTCLAVHTILKNFAQTIHQTLDGSAPPGVDLVREERQAKCRDCVRYLSSIRSALETKEVAARAGQRGRELIVRFQSMC
ncbi:unnamed protein product [Dicrocoelium dendriticum]|nr:unnamed protein product [Dicrocoelium dendriticum]